MRSSKQRDKNILAMAKVVHYGTGWVDGTESVPYRTAALETIAHIVACWLCQEYSHDSEPTNDVLEELGFDTCPEHKPVRYWYDRLRKMVDRRRRSTGR